MQTNRLTKKKNKLKIGQQNHKLINRFKDKQTESQTKRNKFKRTNKQTLKQTQKQTDP